LNGEEHINEEEYNNEQEIQRKRAKIIRAWGKIRKLKKRY
jgi:hypothetical protein